MDAHSLHIRIFHEGVFQDFSMAQMTSVCHLNRRVERTRQAIKLEKAGDMWARHCKFERRICACSLSVTLSLPLCHYLSLSMRRALPHMSACVCERPHPPWSYTHRCIKSTQTVLHPIIWAVRSSWMSPMTWLQVRYTSCCTLENLSKQSLLLPPLGFVTRTHFFSWSHSTFTFEYNCVGLEKVQLFQGLHF